MKRSGALAPLSRDHHHGLVVAQRLARATVETAVDAREGFLSFWATEGRRHFQIEEEILLPAFERHGAAEDEAVVRVLVDHVEIRRRADDLGADASPRLELLHDLGARLQRHIRHEERVLFPLIEEALAADELHELATRVERAERGS